MRQAAPISRQPDQADGVANIFRVYAGFLGSKKYPLMYLNMPKSACSTIKFMINLIDTGQPHPEPLTLHFQRHAFLTAQFDLLRFVEALSRRHTIFTYVRHPGRRAFSCYVDKFLNIDPHFAQIRLLAQERFKMELPENADTLSAARHRSNFSAFIDFVQASIAGDGVPRNYHWHPQSLILQDYMRVTPVDFIGQVESFSTSFSELLKNAGVESPPDLHHKINESRGIKVQYEDVLDETIETKLRNVYGGDYSRFGYG